MTLLVRTALAQQTKAVRTGASRTEEEVADLSGKQLEKMYLAEREAAKTGSPAAVEQASQKLAAMALREMATLDIILSNYEDAIKRCERSVDLDDTAEAHSLLARVYLLADKPHDAVRELDKVLAAEPKDASAWLAKGNANLLTENYDQAINSFRQSEEVKADPNAEFGLAKAYLGLKQKPMAEAVFQKMLQQYGDRAIWHMVFGGGYRDAGYREDAIREFKRASELDPKLPHVHFFLALTILERDTWEPTKEATDELQEAVRLEPGDYLANQYLGAIESKQGKYADSDRHLLIATKADPTSPDPWVFLGSNAYQRGDAELTKQYLLKAVALTGKDEARNNYQIRKAYIILGRLAISGGRREEGSQYIEKSKHLFAEYMKQVQKQIGGDAMASGMGGGSAPGGDAPAIVPPSNLDPVPGDTGDETKSKLSDLQRKAIERREKQLREILGISFNDWGTAEARQKNYAVATELFKEAESWDPKSPGLMRNLGMAAMRQEDYATAARALELAVQTEPGDSALRAMLGMALFNVNSFADSAKAFSPLGDAAFQDSRIAYTWALALIKTNQYAPASEILTKLQAQQSTTDNLILIAQAWTQMGYYPQAVTACHKALQIDPQLKGAHATAGNAYMRLEKYNEAVDEFRAELALSPDDVESEYTLAYVLLRQSKTDEAETHLKGVLARAPDHPGANYQLGKALLDNGQTDQAISYLEAAARLSPNLDYVHYQLQMAYRKLGRSEDAERELAIYKQIKAEKRESSARRLEENSKKAESSNPN